MKKIFVIIFCALFFLFLLPSSVHAAGLVPCGGSGEDPCQFCHFFVLFKNIIEFFLFHIIPPLAALMIVIAGFYFFAAGPNPQMLSKAKEILTSTLWGLIIIFGAWIFVNMFLTFPGLVNADWGWNPAKWFQIDCPIK